MDAYASSFGNRIQYPEMQNMGFFCHYRFMILLNWIVGGGYRLGKYMYTCPWSILPKSCNSCRSFAFLLWNLKRQYCIQKGPIFFLFLVRLIQFILSHTISLRLCNIIISTLRCAKWHLQVFIWNFGCISEHNSSCKNPPSRAPFVIGLIIFD